MTEQLARPAFDPECAVLLAPLQEAMPEITAETIPALRAANVTPPALHEELAKAGVEVRDVSIPGHEGAEIVATVLSRADRRGTGPGILHTHGGGMIAGDRFVGVMDLVPHILELDAVVVTPEYRLAPEFPDPYPVEDCYAALTWTAEHADELGIDLDRLMIAGASAGGGLAAGTALLTRDRRGPSLCAQLLLCPMLDDRDRTVSTHQYPDAGSWVRSANVVGWTALLGDRRGGEDVSVYAAPARATDLSGLPPAFIDCGSAEVFRDEDVEYASRLWAAGVQAELHVWAGGFHGFDMIAPHTPVGQASIAARKNWVLRQLER